MVKHHRSKHTKKRSRSVKRSFKCGKKVKKQTRKTKTKIKTKNIVTYKKCGGGETPNVKHIPMAFSSDGEKVVYGESFKKYEYYNHTGRDYQSRRITVHPAFVMCARKNDYAKCPSSEPRRYLQHMSHDVTVRSVALRPKRNNDDGMVVMATGDDSGSVRIWTHMPTSALYKGKLSTRVHYKVTGLMVSSVAFSPDGTKVVAGFSDGTAHIWQERFAGGPQMWGVKYDDTIHSEHTIMSVKNCEVTSVAFNHNGTKVVAGYDDGTARIWEVKDREPTDSMIETTKPMMIMMHNRSSNSVAFSPDGEKVVAGYRNGTVIIWDVKTVEEPDDTSVMPDDTSVMPDGNVFNGGLKLPRFFGKNKPSSSPLPPPSPPPPSYPLAKCLKKMNEHSDDVTSVAFSPDGTKVVSGSDDKTVRIWEVASGAELNQIPVDNSPVDNSTVDNSSVDDRTVSSVAFTDDDNVIYGYHYDEGYNTNVKIVCIFNVKSGEIKKKSILSD